MAYKIIQLKDKNNNNLMPKNTVKSVYLNDGITTIEQALGLTSSKSTMALGANNILNGTNILSVGGTGVHPTSNVTYSSKEIIKPEGTVSGNKIIFPSGTVVDKIIMKYNGLQEVEGDIYTYFSSWMYFYKSSNNSRISLTAEPKNYYLDKSTNTITIPLSTAITLEEEYYTFNTTLPCGTLTTAEENSYININQVAGGENILTVGKNNQITNSWFNDGIVGGVGNQVKGSGSTSIIFGQSNTTESSIYQSILSGSGNTLKDNVNYSFISGSYNTLDYLSSSLVIGNSIVTNNSISDSLISGNSHTLNGYIETSIIGGNKNELSGTHSSIVSGDRNKIASSLNGSLILGNSGGSSSGLVTESTASVYNSIFVGPSNTVKDNCSVGYNFVLGSGNTFEKNSQVCNIILGQTNTIDNGLCHFIKGQGNSIKKGEGASSLSYNTIFGNSNSIELYSDVCMFGNHLIDGANNQFIIGSYNVKDSDALFVIGNGEYSQNAEGYLEEKRSNCFSVKKDGAVSAKSFSGETLTGNSVSANTVSGASLNFGSAQIGGIVIGQGAITSPTSVTANSIILSDTADSSKKFKITINNGAIAVSEV